MPDRSGVTLIRKATPLLAMYGGRAGTAVVGLLALPLFLKVLGPSAFGVVGVVLALQALVVMLDFGLAVSAGREASSLSPAESWKVGPLVRHIDTVALVLYAGVLTVSIGTAIALKLPVSILTIAAAVGGLGALTHQNACLNALIGRRDFALASAIQFSGVAVRHLLSLVCLYMIAPTIEVFVLTQGAVLLTQAIFTRTRLLGLAGPRPDGIEEPVHARISPALAILGVAGAAALQLDKPIIGALAGSTAVAPYFLASALAITPISFLAGPVAQFFQPSIMLALAQDRMADVGRNISRLFVALSVLTVGPGVVFLVGAEPITRLWLGGEPIQPVVATYLQILVVGGVVGAFGLIPSMLLIARKEYTFLASVSTICTVAVLTLVSLFASKDLIQNACLAYVGYHTVITLMLWLRAATLIPELNTAVKDAPRELAKFAITLIRR